MSKRVEKRRNELLGKEFTNKLGHRCFVIDYKDAHNVMVMFYDTMSISTMEYNNLKKGSFLDKFKPSLYGVGYIGKVGYTARAHTGTTDKDRYLGYYDTPEKAFKVYKRVKEGHIKSLAEKWKGKIDDKVYESLLQWKIEITD